MDGLRRPLRCPLKRPERRHGLLLLNQFWGQGIAARAIRAVPPFCWNDLTLHRIEATIEENTARSLRLAERLGLVYEGTRRDGARINGRWRNLRVYSALAGDRQFSVPA